MGKPFVGRTSNKLSIHLTRRLNNSDGSFAGVAIITMDPFYFTRFYRDMDFTEKYTIRMAGRDGIIRAGNHVAELGQDLAGSELFRHLATSSTGFYNVSDSTTGQSLWMSYRASADYPIIIQVGLSDESLTPFFQRRNVFLAFSVGISLFIVFSALYIIARARKERQNATWLRTFVSNTPVVFYAMDLNGKFILSEGLTLKSIGLKAGEVVGCSVFEIYRDYPDILGPIRRAIGGEAVLFEHQVSDIHLSNRVLPVFDEDGRLTSIVGAAVDITERVQAEQRLSESFAQLTATHEELVATEEELRLQYSELNKANKDLLAQNAVLEALREMAAALMAETDLDRMLKTIIDWGTISIGAQHGSIALLNEQDRVMQVLSGAGLFEKHQGIRLHIDEGIVAEVYRSGKPSVVRNYNTCEKRLKNLDLEGIRCLAMAPLQRGGAVIGVMGVAFTDETDHFAEKEQELMLRFAELASIAVENMRKMDELHRSQKTAMDIFHAVADGLVVTDIKTGEILAANRRAEEMFGYSEAEFKECGMGLVLTNSQKETVLQETWKRVTDAIRSPFECEARDRTGRRLILEVTTAPVEIDGTRRALASIRDVTARKLMEEGLEYLRQRDSLTGAYNRTYFETDMIRLPVSKQESIGIFVCDVDGLKLINDTLGHHQGDELLKVVAGLLIAGVKAPDYVARIGGDEFAIVLFDSTEKRMEELEPNYRSRVAVYNRENPQLPLSLSLGWAMGDGEKVENIIKMADNNMYRQKIHQSHSIRSSIVQTLTKALEARDHITEGHAERLGNFMLMMGQRLKLPQQIIADLQLFAKFHDIGKVGIPDSILKKQGRLTADEMSIMRQHSEIGFRIAKSSPDLEPISDWILKHHEYWNGNGYPMGISGEDIPLESRILSIVDTYDAMTSDRPYRDAVSCEEALAEIHRCAGTQFDPALADIFITHMNQKF